ncbi:MAG: protein kinase family protein, partial [Actinomycetota bacterium]|nr:protein kinase family protein [Actinomycetota bacterium]
MTVEPGRLLAGRYRVEDLLSDRAGARSWRAVDEVLRRSVAVDILPGDAPRAAALLDAARRSAVVTDGRFLRVLDAAEEGGDAYVVREWARGESLDLILAAGPLPHRRAGWLVREVAAALTAAHAHRIHHLRLIPENVVVTDTGAVKVVGLATEAALHGVRHADPEAEDVRDLGRLLYACLVARWPGGRCGALAAAPSEHGRVLRPRQVRAGVPRALDAVCDQLLGDAPREEGPPLRHACGGVALAAPGPRGSPPSPIAEPSAAATSAACRSG